MFQSVHFLTFSVFPWPFAAGFMRSWGQWQRKTCWRGAAWNDDSEESWGQWKMDSWRCFSERYFVDMCLNSFGTTKEMSDI